jgi:hypothetical protein
LKQGDYDLEYSDIGYYQEELTCRSAAPGSMDLENVIPQSNGNLITSAESKMNGLSHHEEDGKRKTSASEFFSFAFVYDDLNLPHFCCRQRNELAGQEHDFDAQKCTFWKKVWRIWYPLVRFVHAHIINFICKDSKIVTTSCY